MTKLYILLAMALVLPAINLGLRAKFMRGYFRQGLVAWKDVPRMALVLVSSYLGFWGMLATVFIGTYLVSVRGCDDITSATVGLLAMILWSFIEDAATWYLAKPLASRWVTRFWIRDLEATYADLLQPRVYQAYLKDVEITTRQLSC